MNTKLFAGLLPVAFGLLCAVSAPASAGYADALGEWEGTGSTVAVGGAEQGDFHVSLVRRSSGPGAVRSEGRVVLAGGQVIPFWQDAVQGNGGTFRFTSNQGSGLGRCFSNGMCQSYETRRDGHDMATTIVVDSPDKIRILMTELENGKAIRFMQQTLTKKP